MTFRDIKSVDAGMGYKITYNMCVTLPSLICVVTEAHESLDKLKKAVSGVVETLQSCEATVNVKENSQYITLSCKAFYLSLFISLFFGKTEGGDRERERGADQVTDPAEGSRYNFSVQLSGRSLKVS